MRRSASLLVPSLLLTLTLVALAPATALGYSKTTMFGTWEVPVTDIAGLGAPRSQVLVKAFSPGMNIVAYLDKAKAYGQQVAVYFTDTVDYATGKIYPSRIKAWVDKVKRHTALYGYVSVKEPSWSGISLAEMRTLYKAYKAADPAHRVIALLGDVPHFGSKANPWASGVANMLWIDWYPVTYSRGYIATASKWFPKIRAYVNRVTPGVPIWLMVQTHGYKPGDRKTPTATQLTREVRDGFNYLKASGILFHTWNNPRYGSDLKRNTALWSTVRSIMTKVRAGTF
jgi:hypothetical protein